MLLVLQRADERERCGRADELDVVLLATDALDVITRGGVWRMRRRA